jgi:hypothetical protein
MDRNREGAGLLLPSQAARLRTRTMSRMGDRRGPEPDAAEAFIGHPSKVANLMGTWAYSR